jgi:hypothetical protein
MIIIIMLKTPLSCGAEMVVYGWWWACLVVVLVVVRGSYLVVVPERSGAEARVMQAEWGEDAGSLAYIRVQYNNNKAAVFVEYVFHRKLHSYHSDGSSFGVTNCMYSYY